MFDEANKDDGCSELGRILASESRKETSEKGILLEAQRQVESGCNG